MKLLILLLVLWLRRLQLNWPHWLVSRERHHGWLMQLHSRTGGAIRVWVMGAVAPAAVVAAVFALSSGVWGLLFMVLAGPVLLLWILGAESEFRLVDEMLVRGRMNDCDGVATLAKEEFQVEGNPQDKQYESQLADSMLERELQLFAAVFWLITLGVGAALFYVLNRAWCQWSNETEFPHRLNLVLTWLPQRLLMFCMALAGNYGAVMAKLSGFFWHIDTPPGLLTDTAWAALENGEENEGDIQAVMDGVEDLQGLMLRCLGFWLILSAIWVMLS